MDAGNFLEVAVSIRDSARSLEQKDHVLAETLIQNYISIVELDLVTGNMLVFRAQSEPELENLVYPWPLVLERFARFRVVPEDREAILSLTLERMREAAASGFRGFPVEYRCVSDKDERFWVQIEAWSVPSDPEKVLIATHNISQDKILRSIVERFVYKNVDYLVVLDVRHNTFTRLSSAPDGVPVPPESGEDYTQCMIEFNKRYIAPEDVDRVISNMQIPYMLKKLEETEEFSFTCGRIPENGVYRRSQVQISYYDKPSGLILISRTDVTQIYLDEQAKNTRLAAAMRAARHDALTGLYNQKATVDLIIRSLDSQYRSLSALLFIDVDNFKLVNDTLGHQAGDRLLCYLAKFLRSICGKDDIAGRIGGDEFLLFLPSLDSANTAAERAAEICGMFRSTEILPENLLVTCSVGISLYPTDGTDYSTLNRKADQALYISKRYGKNQYYFYSEKANDHNK